MQFKSRRQIFTFLIILVLSLAPIHTAAGNTPLAKPDRAETAATTTISGVVTDGGVPEYGSHGYPLYARIRVTASGFDQTIFTDPITGTYSIDLEQGIEYTFTINAFPEGYQTLVQTITPAVDNTTLDFALLVDPLTCTAPGYQQDYDIFYDFESSSQGFTPGATTSFAWGDITSGPLAGHSGTKGIATNLSGDYAPNESGYMLSPPIDLSPYGDDPAILQWWDWKDLEIATYDSACLEATNDGGATWTTLWGPIGGDHDTTYHQQTVLLDPIYNVTNFQFRFFFESDGTLQYTGWYIDDIGILRIPITATPYFSTNFDLDKGGFSISGTNPSWAWGAPTSGPGTAHSAPNVWATNLAGDYNTSESSWLTSPLIDLSAFAGQMPILSFFQWNDIEHINYDWGAVEASKDGGITWQNVSGNIGDINTWSPKTIILDPAYAVSNFTFRFYFRSDTSTNFPGWYIDDLSLSIAEPALLSARCIPEPGGVLAGYVYDENTGSPLVGAEITSSSIISQSLQWESDAAHAGVYWAFQPTLTDPEVIDLTAAMDLYSSRTVAVSLIQDAVNPQNFNLSAGELGFDPTAFTIPMTMGDLPSDHLLTLENSGNKDVNFTLSTADFGYEIPMDMLPAEGESHLARVPYDGIEWDPDMVQLLLEVETAMRNASVSWLTLDPISGMVPGASSQAVILNLNPADLPQPGDYKAEINIAHDTPYTYENIPVTLQLAAPPDWGTFKGTVTGMQACDINPAPIAGATISFWQDGTQKGSFTTTETGYYTYSLPNGTYDIRVSMDGFLDIKLPELSLPAGTTQTQDFSLRLLAPCLAVTPESLEQTMPPSGRATQTLRLTNTGAAEASVEILEAGSNRDAMIVYENFEIGRMPPDGWYTIHNGLTNQRWIVTSDPKYVYEGDFSAWKKFDQTLNSDEWLVSPLIDATLLTDLKLNFMAFSDTNYPGATVKLWVTDDAGTPLTTEPLWDLIRDESWADLDYRLITPDISLYNRYGPFRLAWQYVGLNGQSFGLDLIQVTGNVDVTWLTREPTHGVIAPDGGEFESHIGFDATGMEDGDYFAALSVITPSAPMLTIPVALHVETTTTPFVSDIPDQTVFPGQSFSEIALDDYVIDSDHASDQILWSFSDNVELIVTIDENQVARITVPDEEWAGSETITFIAQDPDGHTGQDGVSFTVISADDSSTMFLPLILR